MPAGAVIQVDSIGDSNARDGVVTLREAILLATGGLSTLGLDAGEAENVTGSSGGASAEAITFDRAIFPPSQPATIALSSPLPALSSGGDVIETAGAGVILRGRSRTFDCLVVTSSGNAIRGLQVRNCRIGVLLEAGTTGNTIGGPEAGRGNVFVGNQTGVRIAAGSDSNAVQGNRIGPDRPGGTGDANELGIFVGGRENVIGGGNVISGNDRVGVTISGAGNVVKGSYVGTDPSGYVAVPNAMEGIWVAGEGNTVGGSTAAERNVISGNGLFGINVSGSGARANVVKGNYIGVDAGGWKALGNRNGVGVSFGAQNNVIGGTAARDGNVISGNGVGVLVRDPGTASNAIKGNRIGTDATGQQPLPNGTGIFIFGGAQKNVIGGTARGEGNVISANATGVLVEGSSTTGNTVRGNAIFSNSGAGIEVSNGGNGGLSPPVVADLGPVRGSVCAGCTVDVYSDSEDEGRTYEGSGVAGPGGEFEARVKPGGPNVTVTATDANGNTSPFSHPLPVPP